MSAHTKELVRGVHNLRPRHRGSVATIGSFDGVHLGHQSIIRQLRAKSQALKLPAVAVIFEPQPREFFQVPVARILPLREKVQYLFAAGIDTILCLRFNAALSQLTAREFVEKLLVTGLGVKHLVVGDDFRFGHNQEGDSELLAELAQRHQFDIASTDAVEIDGVRVSSTLIRESLEEGDFKTAEKMLNRPFAISGRVVQGRQLGGELGIPTANVRLRHSVLPVRGSFAVTVELGDNTSCKGVANVGVRPTVSNKNQPLLEAHLFDYDGNLYGRRINVIPHLKIRDEKKFESLAQLKTQIQNDIATAKKFFS